VREYRIPAYGPDGNLFHRADIETFLANPEAFRKPRAKEPRRHLGGFTPVSV
jgi:hypothetical protein